MTSTRWLLLGSILLLSCSLSPAHAQRYWGYGYGGGYGGGYGYPFSPFGGWGASRMGNYGSFGPRPVTWYVPGQGYSSYTQTGLPWQGIPAIPPAVSYPDPTMMDPGYGMPDDTAIVRQELARRRLNTLYALQLEAKRRNHPGQSSPALAASSKDLRPAKTKKKSTASKPATMADEPTKLVPVVSSSLEESPVEYSSAANPETLSVEKRPSR